MDESQCRWLYALSAPMVAINPGAGYFEAAFYASPEPIDLNCSWGINNRQQLLNMLSMADNGHARHLNEAYYRWPRCLPSEWQRLLQGLDARSRVLYEFASHTFAECGSGGIRAWDLGRMGFLLRCALRNQWVTEEESLWLHWRMALRARAHYCSWSHFFNGFLMGRAFWVCENCGTEQLLHALDRQGSDAGCLAIAAALVSLVLEDLPWDLPLDPPERPTTLESYEWS